ncbi:MAG TPA: GNAT family N-acetyltransferase [Kofleriaceae bacterium]|nr:GNAT family N-acetyltransferase [Kofleriaceae bacterium]
MFFGADYVERATLRDGTRVVLRLTVPDDKEILRRGFEHWSAESRYARFLAPKSRLTDDELAYLCDVDQINHFAIGAIREEGDGHGEPVGLGIARFIRLADVDPPTAEAAIAVADEAQGLGLGRLLFLRLAAAAAERGIVRFRAEVLGSNASMKGLIDLLSTERHVEVGGGVMSIDFALPQVARDAAKAPDGGMYELIRAAAQATRMKKRAGS